MSFMNPEQDQCALVTERRADARFAFDAAAFGCDARGQAPFFEGRMVNLSAKGVGLLVDRKLEPGVTVFFACRQAGICHGERLAKVIHVGPEQDGHWSIGCEFLSPLSEEELRWYQTLGRDVLDLAIS